MNDTDRLTAFTRVHTAEELYAKGYADGYENGRMSKEPVFFPPCEDCNKKMDEVRKAYDHRQAQISDTISELENIKARLNHRANEHLDGDYYVRIKDINEVIDEELARLKGE